MVLPILNDLKSAADRQEGRDLERLDAEKRRDKSWGRFRQAIVTITMVGTLIVGLLELNKQIKIGSIHMPKIGASYPQGQMYTAHIRIIQQDAGLPYGVKGH
jgi:hypothetical protein